MAATLELEGWSIVHKNLRWRGGEVDVVAAKDEVLAFIEVKSWAKYDIFSLEQSLSRRKQARIVETSKIFLEQHRQYNNWQIRYDVFLVNKETIVRRICGAFLGEL